MKIVALFPWYDEPADMLYDSMASLAPHIDYMLAADGAYTGFPDGRNQSPEYQYEAIRSGLADHGCSQYEIITPGNCWENEIEKRTFLFTYGGYRTRPHQDWYIVWDADMFVTQADHLHEDLGWSGQDSAAFLLNSSPASAEPPVLTHRMAYRAIPGLQLVENHSVFGYPDGDGGWNYLWGHPDAPPPMDLSKTVRVRHEPDRRTPERLARKHAFDPVAWAS